MSVALKTIEDNIVAVLRTNITDPINRTVGQFIDHGKEHYKAKTPIITVSRMRSSKMPFTGIGEVKHDYNLVYKIQLNVQSSVSGIVDSVKYSGNELANMLSDKIYDVMENNATSITGVKIARPISSGDYHYDDLHVYVHLYEIEVLNN